mmetsp:Transcript_40066/g.78481  ORF Transcript_40066/g.78481 Transcript_40066/m.78481 type:complete len:112 (+) Transcript_40066:530-865(+)
MGGEFSMRVAAVHGFFFIVFSLLELASGLSRLLSPLAPLSLEMQDQTTLRVWDPGLRIGSCVEGLEIQDQRKPALLVGISTAFSCVCVCVWWRGVGWLCCGNIIMPLVTLQ